jgi:multisubunit Na+/H+ antiporter MnhB subunit
MRQAVALASVLAIGALLAYAVTVYLLPFGSFPERRFGEFENESVGQRILRDAPQSTGAANVVTSVVWDYRGYDTLGEATVLFTAVCGVAMLFRAARRRG